MEFLIFQFILTAANAPEISFGMTFIIIYILFPLCAFLSTTLVKPATGQINRMPYFGFWFLIAVLSYSFMMAMSSITNFQNMLAAWGIFFFSVAILMILSQWMGKLAVRRARDAGKNPRLGAIAIIPIVGFILFFLPSRANLNSDELQKVFE